MRSYLGSDPRMRAGLAVASEVTMPILYTVGAVLSAGLFIYLVFALLKPEMFS
ncbi:MAG: hypothetical protein NVS3B20_07650 [Polyangiales bacterium]